MILLLGAHPIEIQTIQRVYKYTEVKNMCDHRLPKQAWNIWRNVQKTNENKILSSGWVLDIMKWFKVSGIKDLLEFLGDVMKYVIIIKDMLLDALRMKWQDLEMLTLEYYIAICKY